MMKYPIIKLDTNFNGKLACETIVHISSSPSQLINESQMNGRYIISTADESYPPAVFQFVDLARMLLNDIPMAYTWCSHGMTRLQFIEWWLDKYPGSHLGKELGVYFYQKVDEPIADEPLE